MLHSSPPKIINFEIEIRLLDLKTCTFIFGSREKSIYSSFQSYKCCIDSFNKKKKNNKKKKKAAIMVENE